MATLASLVVELAANTAKFQQGMQQAVGTAQKSASQIQSSLSSIQASFGGAIAMVQRFAGALGLVVGVGGLVAAGRAAMNFADEIDEMSQRLGIGVERLQELRFAAAQNGVSAEQLERGIRTLSDTIGEAARGEAAAVKKFDEMGVSIEGAVGHVASFETIMGRVADKVAAAATPIEKINLANKAFGDRVGTFLIPILNRGAQGLEEFAQAAREAGVVLSKEMIQQAAKAKDQLDAMGLAIMANLVPAIVAVSPLLIKMAQGLSDIAAAAGRALGSFAPFAAMSTEDLRAQLAKVDADLATRREFLQKLREENEERAKGAITQFLPKSPGAIPHEIQRLQLEKEAIEKVLRERADVSMTVTGTGQKIQPPFDKDAWRDTVKAMDDSLARLASRETELEAQFKVPLLGIWQKSIDEGGPTLETFSGAIVNLRGTIADLGEMVIDTADGVEALDREFESSTGALDLDAAMAKFNATMASASPLEDLFRKQTDETAESVSLLGVSTQKITTVVDDMGGAFVNASGDMTALEVAFANINAQGRALGPTFDVIGAKLAKVRQDITEAIERGEQYEGQLAELGAAHQRLSFQTELQQFANQWRTIAATSEVLGNSFDIVAAKTEATRQALIRLMGLPQTTETQAAIANLTAELDKLNAVAMAQTGIRDIFGALNQAVNQSIAGVIQGTLTLEEAFKNMGQSIALSLIQNVINRGINVVMEAVIAMVAKLAAAGLSGAGAGAFPAVGTTLGAGGGSGYGYRPAAEGAYVKHSPGGSLMLVGEGGKDEAIFPLERVPVNPGNGGGKTSIVINNNAGAQVGASEKQTPDGRQIEVMIDRVVTDGFSSGRYGGVLSSTYGLNRKGRVS